MRAFLSYILGITIKDVSCLFTRPYPFIEACKFSDLLTVACLLEMRNIICIPIRHNDFIISVTIKNGLNFSPPVSSYRRMLVDTF